MKETAVSIKNITKSFKLPTENTNSLKRLIINFFKGIKGYREQEVLRGISFDVYKGDFFGIVGRNGSGKSTLLKIISQIYWPEAGTVTIDGRLVSFIELGVGFNPELTGRENVYLNGAMLGFSEKEIDVMYDDIVEFAELSAFMNQKLKNYSSGMQVRLAFSVAIQAKSDILVLDEVLAVGDEAFQRKCNDYFMQARADNKTIILVTHSMDAVRKYCNRAVMIDNGLVKVLGTPDEVANQYSLDNVMNSGAQVLEETQKETDRQIQAIENVQVTMFTPEILAGADRRVEFEISYDVNEELSTYIAFSMTDIDRNMWMYNDNSLDQATQGTGHKVMHYCCQLDHINQCKLALIVSVRDMQHRPLAFNRPDNSPVIILSPEEDLNESRRDAATGVLVANGIWKEQSQSSVF